MADYNEMSIEQLEAEGNRIEEGVKAARAEQLVVHQVAERKRKALPLIGGPGQQFTPGTDWVAWAKGLPKAAIEAIKGINQ